LRRKPSEAPRLKFYILPEEQRKAAHRKANEHRNHLFSIDDTVLSI